jgi:YVTN family beta-propeller protein
MNKHKIKFFVLFLAGNLLVACGTPAVTPVAEVSPATSTPAPPAATLPPTATPTKAAPTATSPTEPSADSVWINYTVEKDIPAHFIQDIAVAPDGSVWVSVGGDGVLHFDGENWTTYTADDIGETLVDVQSVAVDAKGILWAGSLSSLIRFDGESWVAYEDSAVQTINDLAIKLDGTLWVCGFNNVYGYRVISSFDGTTWTDYSEEIETGCPESIAIGQDGVLWIRDNGGSRCGPFRVVRFDGKTATYFTEQDYGPVDYEMSGKPIAVGPDGAVWVGMAVGLLRFDGESWTTYTTEDGLVSNNVTALAVEPDGRLWVGTREGVSRFDGETWTTYTTQDGLVSNNISSVAVESNGAVWVGTDEGISHYIPSGKVVAEPAESAQPITAAPTETEITIDGDPSDWERYDVLITDPQNDHEGGGFDIAALRAFGNDKFLYALVETHRPPADYVQVDLEVSAGDREFIISFRPQEFSSGFMGDVTGGEFKEIGEVVGSQSAAGQAVEFKLPLSAFQTISDLSLSVRPMAGECCQHPDWYAVDSLASIPVVALNEVEPAVDLAPLPSPPEQAQMIEQTQLDLSRYRCDEPADIVTNADRSLAYAVCGNVDTLFVINTGTNQVIDALPLHEVAQHPFGPAPRQIEITPDDAMLLVANEMDSSLTLIDAATLSVITTLRLDMEPQRIAVSPDGNIAYVVGHASGHLTVVDLNTRQILMTPPLPGLIAPYSVAFAPDGSAAYVAAIEGGMYQIDPATHQPIKHVDLPEAGWRGDMVVTKNGATVYLAAVGSDWIAEIDTATMQMTRQLDVMRPQALLLSEDESVMFVGNFTSFTDFQPLVVLDLASGALVDQIVLNTPAPHVAWTPDIEGLAFVGDGTRIYAPGIDADGIFVIDVATQRQSGFIPLNDYAVYQPEHLIISSDGSTLYTVNIAPQAPAVSVIDVAGGDVTTHDYRQEDEPCFGQAGSIDITPDDSTLYVSTDTCLLTFDTASTSFIASTPIDLPAGNTIRDLVISPAGNLIYLVDSGGVVSTLDRDTLTVTGTVQAIEDGYNIKISPDGSRVYVTGWTQYAAINTSTNTVLTTETINVSGNEQLNAYPDRAIGIPPGHEFYTIGDFFYMQVYHAATNQLLRSIDLEPWAPGRTLVTDVIFSPDGNTGYLALWDLKGVTAFDPTTWQVVAQIDTGLDPVYCICPNDFAISPDGSRLYVTCEQSDNIVVIDAETNQVVDVIELAP